MTDIPEEHHAEIACRAEALVHKVQSEMQAILDGLADLPKPGAKSRAREATARVLRANADLWQFIEGKKPVVFAPR